MKINKIGLSILIFIQLMFMSVLNSSVLGQDKKLVVRIAKLKIDSAQLENYKAALKEHAETAVRIEPGVLTLYAVAEKDHPTSITVFEIYASQAAYKMHIQTPHFLKYKSTTMAMVKSLELIETDPIALEAKPIPKRAD